jgi:hypothetical protein
MKTLNHLFCVFLLFTSITSCNSNHSENLNPVIKYRYTGYIIGQDLALCPCCGNWIIKINGIENNFQTIEIPDNLNLNLIDAIFPIPIKLNWHLDQNSVCGYIIIDDIALNN